MSDYTQITNFTAKDDMPPGTVAKKILGSEWDAEFNAIVTAIASKYDDTDVADQSTAEAGASDSVLISALRAAQAAAAARITRQSMTHDSYVTKAMLGVNTTIPFAGAEQVLWTIAVPAAGLYMYDIHMPMVEPDGEFSMRPTFSGTVLAHYLSIFGLPGLGGTDKASTVDPELSAVTNIVVMSMNSTDSMRLRGCLYCSTSGTLSIRARAVIDGFPTDPIVHSSAYVALRRLV